MKLVLGVVLSVAAVIRAAQPAVAETQQAAKPVLPAGAGKEVVTKFCDDCHDLESTVAGRRLPAEWKEVLDRMHDLGLSSNRAEDAKIFAYLTDQLGKVDLNNSAAKELRAVLDITKEQADAIVAARPFGFVADLAKVPGFDDKKIGPLRERLVVTPIKR